MKKNFLFLLFLLIFFEITPTKIPLLQQKKTSIKSTTTTKTKTKTKDNYSSITNSKINFEELWKRISKVFKTIQLMTEVDMHNDNLATEVIKQSNQYRMSGLSVAGTNIIMHPIFELCKGAIYDESNEDAMRVCGFITARNSLYKELTFKLEINESFTCIRLFGNNTKIYIAFIDVKFESCSGDPSIKYCGKPVLISITESGCCNDGTLPDGTKYYSRFVVKPLSNDVSYFVIKLKEDTNFCVHLDKDGYPPEGEDRNNFTLKYFRFPTEITTLFTLDNCEYSGPAGECFRTLIKEDLILNQSYTVVIKMLSYFDPESNSQVHYEDFLRYGSIYDTDSYFTTISDRSLKKKATQAQPSFYNLITLIMKEEEIDDPEDPTKKIKINYFETFWKMENNFSPVIIFDENSMALGCEIKNKIYLEDCNDPGIRGIKYSQYYKIRGSCENQVYQNGKTNYIFYKKGVINATSDGIQIPCFAIYRIIT